MARARKNSNRGATSLATRKRKGDPMADYDRLPPELRQWMQQAKLPWAPRSCKKIWLRARAEGARPEEVLTRLDRAEMATLAKDRFAQP
jgi:hypothetical protein